MSRFYVEKKKIRGKKIIIDGQEARHILNTMRLSPGDGIMVFDGTGKEYYCLIRSAGKRSVEVEVVNSKDVEPDNLPMITLVQAIPKKSKMDHIVEKATELGVAQVFPVISERTIVKFDGVKGEQKSARWQKIAKEASKQCGRPDVPRVLRPMSFRDALTKIDEYDLCLLASIQQQSIGLKDAFVGFNGKKIAVFIGPEGDFSAGEVKLAMSHKKCKLVSLGRRVLKSDTAGIFVLSCLNYLFS